MKDCISVVIPIYNRASSLEKCLRTVMRQDYGNLEVILINDGSTDGSADICQRWVQQYPDEVFYYEKENGGVSSARNLGIQKATGQYIQFVDSDDYVDTHYSSKMIHHMENVDLVISGYSIVKDNKIISTIRDKEKKYTYQDFLENILTFIYPNNLLYSPFNKLYSLKIIREHDLTFREGCIIGEDALFNIQYIAKTKNIMVIENQLYYYEKSGSNTATSKVTSQWFPVNYEISSQIRLLLKASGVAMKDSTHYCTYTQQLTGLYFTRLFAFKRQGNWKNHIFHIHQIICNYKKWDIVTFDNQKKSIKFLLYLIDKDKPLLGTIYTIGIRWMLSIRMASSK